MNLEKINLKPQQSSESAPKETKNPSSLDKLRTIKKDVKEERQKELAEFDALTARRDEIMQELDEIKLRRDEIMTKGKEVITEAKQDKEVEKTLRTKEVFADVFSEEKAEWKQLQDRVEELNGELKNLNSLISSKEGGVQDFLEQRKQEEQEKQGKHQKYMQSIKEGINFDLNLPDQDSYEDLISRLRRSISYNDKLEVKPSKDIPTDDYYEALTEIAYEKLMSDKNIQENKNFKKYRGLVRKIKKMRNNK